MKFKSYSCLASAAMAAGLLALATPCAAARSVTDEIAMVRDLLKSDRKVAIADNLPLTEAESTAFWKIYAAYRAEMGPVGDGQVKLVLEYSDIYPAVSEAQAQSMFKQWTELEESALKIRQKYLKQLTKVIPTAKVLRFAQLENRLDLVIRLQLAVHVPLVEEATHP